MTENDDNEEDGIFYIYKITNLINGKFYIGQRKCPKNKTPETDSYFGSGKRLKKAIQKYGIENFKKEIISKDIHYKETIDILERSFVINAKCINIEIIYNICDGGEGGSVKGRIFTEETRKKMSEAHKGKTTYKMTAETRKKMNEANKGQIPWNKGKKNIYSTETLQKFSEASKGNKNASKKKEGYK